MARLGPFEPRPALAVAVSGGRDSMALALLAQDWVTARDGSLTGLIVDHGLRAASAGEARRTAGWLRQRGIPATILRWQGEKPDSGLQAGARAARYDLLCAWCRQWGILHLLTAHQRDDQSETRAMRAARGGEGWGTAGMAAARIEQGVRLLRPLLRFPRGRLQAVLTKAGQAWLDDPSNDDERFERVRVRHALARAEAPPATVSADGSARARMTQEKTLARLAAECLSLHPAGFVVIGRRRWMAADDALAEALLRQTLRCIGGSLYAPALDKCADLAAAVRTSGRALRRRTLGGCRIQAEEHAILITREYGRLPPPLPLRPGETVRWDRFRIALSATAPAGSFSIGALGPDGWRHHREELHGLPREAAIVLPTLQRDGEILYTACPGNGEQRHSSAFQAHFLPPEPLLGAGLRVV